MACDTTTGATDAPMTVILRQRMAALAVGLTGVLSGWASSAKGIGARGYKFHVSGVHAVASAAKVVYLKSSRDSALQVLIGIAMSVVHAVGLPFAGYGKLAVPTGLHASMPEPTAIRKLYLRPKPRFLWQAMQGLLDKRAAVLSPALVVHAAVAPSGARSGAGINEALTYHCSHCNPLVAN